MTLRVRLTDEEENRIPGKQRNMRKMIAFAPLSLVSEFAVAVSETNRAA